MRIAALVIAAGLAAAAWAAPAKAPDPSAEAFAPPGSGGIEVEVRTPRPFSEKRKPLIPITWRADLDKAKQEAAGAGRCVLIFFYAGWSQPCQWMDEGTFVSPAVARLVTRQFVPVKVDDSEGTSAVTALYQVRLYPTVLFLDPGGNPLHIVLGPRPPDQFEPLLKQVADLVGLLAAQRARPDDREANFALGNAFALLHQLKRAAPYLERAAALAPANENRRLSQARLLLAVVPLEDGDADAALRNLEAYLKQFKDAPEAPVAVWYQGTILFQDGRYEESREHFLRILRDFPKHPKAYEADKALEAIAARLKAREAAKARGAGQGSEPPQAPAPPPGPPAPPEAPAPARAPARKPLG